MVRWKLFRNTSEHTRGVVVIFHGGKERSRARTRWFNPGVFRALLLGRSLHRRVAILGVDVWCLRYSLRGWNAPELSAVNDARIAVRSLATETPDIPVVLVGHSMGGRTAFRVADEPNVVGVVGIAPWVPAGEPVETVRDRIVHIAHGSADRVTDPDLSLAFSDRARSVAKSVAYELVDGDGHSLLRRFGVWNRIVFDATLSMLQLSGRVGSD